VIPKFEHRTKFPGISGVSVKLLIGGIFGPFPQKGLGGGFGGKVFFFFFFFPLKKGWGGGGN